VACVEFDVLTAVVINFPIFWDITPCSQIKVNNIPEEHVASIIRVEE
jgi:hypothetical protein